MCDLFVFLSTLSLRRATISAIGCKSCVPFLSTLSLRRATVAFASKAEGFRISIHALLAESDTKQNNPPIFQRYFYPRSPCGERRSAHSGAASRGYFYPRSPCGERRTCYCSGSLICNFYPRSPCGERPTKQNNPPIFQRYFYPRSPCGERQ